MTTAQLAKSTQPSSTAGATVLSTTDGNNIIQADVTYYIKFIPSLPDRNLSGRDFFPYIWVYSSQPKEELGLFPEWKVIKTGKSNGGIVLPVSEVGQYRLYLREPKTTHKIGDSFTTPYHISTDPLDNIFTPNDNRCEVASWFTSSSPMNNSACNTSPYHVQPLFTINVTEVTNGLQIKTLYPIDYPGRLTAKQNDLKYPTANKTYQLTSKHTLKAPLDLGDYAITYQLWGDACQTYGKQHPYIQKSHFSQALKDLYGGKVSLNAKPLRGFSFTFQDGIQTRKLIIQDNATNNARIINSFKSKDEMSGLEAIRKTHPVVFEYWFTVMSKLNMVTSTVSGAWRPKEGSILHRYSLGLDINKFTAHVTNTTTNQTTTAEVLLNRSVTSCAPVKVSELTNATPAKRALTTKLFAYIAQDTLSSTRSFNSLDKNYNIANDRPLLGWLGAPWAMTYKALGIGNETVLAINTDKIHEHHLHITLKDDLV